MSLARSGDKRNTNFYLNLPKSRLNYEPKLIKCLTNTPTFIAKIYLADINDFQSKKILTIMLEVASAHSAAHMYTCISFVCARDREALKYRWVIVFFGEGIYSSHQLVIFIKKRCG